MTGPAIIAVNHDPPDGVTGFLALSHKKDSRNKHNCYDDNKDEKTITGWIKTKRIERQEARQRVIPSKQATPTQGLLQKLTSGTATAMEAVWRFPVPPPTTLGRYMYQTTRMAPGSTGLAWVLRCCCCRSLRFLRVTN
ncbi:hypothetical protein ElyMa_000248700 [Elysia marginata]|uniref:Uncharacterized protein n=1 Tax=Elysia marginata TaxID=1093978 RepID=A0AAV4F2I8_9GAST|nr:hypothetical protein ElyMa_000248700 [Elysia marginata]